MLLWFALVPQVGLAAKPNMDVDRAIFNSKTGTLKVTVATRGVTGTLKLLHGSGGLLSEQTIAGNRTRFTVSGTRLGQPPCTVEIRAGARRAVGKVSGAPTDCRKIPVCGIVAPADGARIAVNTPLDFAATARLKDKNAAPLAYEWDFGGGVFEDSHPLSLKGQASFVRDNASYRVRFAATDAKGRRCEAAVELKVGTPPTEAANFPAKVAERPAPPRGAETNGDRGDLVVLPFQEWSMQHTSDLNQNPNAYDSFNHLFNTLNAYIIEKGSVGGAKPRFLNPSEVDLRYSAASNPQDPAGADSINSTSQNWPLNADIGQPAPFLDPVTTLKKTDIWEVHPDRDPAKLDFSYRRWSAAQSLYGWAGLHNAIPGLPAPDEGYFPHATLPLEGEQPKENFQYYLDQYAKFQTLIPPGVEHGSYMPGKANPYAANQPQAFAQYDAKEQWFRAEAIPITSVDDRGRVNPYPLLRVEASRKGSATVTAVTDGVLSNSRDFHCRECHAKGQIAANPNAGHKPQAFLSSPKGQDPWYFDLRDPNFRPERPVLYAAENDSLYAQEYAASLNYSSVHDFYDGYDFVGSIFNGGGSMWSFHNGPFKEDAPKTCNGCHFTAPEGFYKKETHWAGAPYDNRNLYYNPDYSMSMHRFHGELQYNGDKSDILRNEKGAYLRFDWKTLSSRTPNGNLNPNTLFPIFDANGKQLPMEENCLKCHAGHREPLYNDRMKTAGVTCYDCHGDMLAMGRAFPKDAAKTGSSNVTDYRIAWLEETDCGSCHSGKGTEAVRTTAFEPTDLSATTRPVDKSNADAARFAVVPNYTKELESYVYHWDAAANGGEGADVDDYTPQRVDAPLYRMGKDQHAGLACAACHGAAHGVGPNRDPKANENITAVQLQGYAGPVSECNVCHTQDAFNTLESIGSALHYPDQSGQPTILAGPHNLHPVNDPYWWKSTEGDTPNADGTTYGGWHNNYAKKPDQNGKDQCAACHGDDHKGTRLSKTPVDRVFDFRNLNTAKLKRAGFKSKVVKVAAGTPIGCDTCHRLDLSFTGVPGR